MDSPHIFEFFKSRFFLKLLTMTCYYSLNSVLDDMIEDMADQLKKTHEIEEFSHVALPTQEEVTVVGRICCDSNGKLNAKSVLLEGSVDMSAGKTIPVDLTQLKEYALFPGQVLFFRDILGAQGCHGQGKSSGK